MLPTLDLSILACNYSFKWYTTSIDVFKLQLADGADVVLSSYDCLNIKPAGKSGVA
jgi:hypothetical protein